MKYYNHREVYRHYKREDLNECQEDKYENINLKKIEGNNSEIKKLSIIFFIGFVLISLPSITWSGVETYFNINYVDHTYLDGSPIILSNNPNAVDPTYEELITFLKNNQPNQNGYDLHPFLRAQKLHDKAEEVGYMCAWVSVSLEEGEEQVCNAFKTADRGIVFVDNSNGNSVESRSSLVDVNIGEQYVPRDMLHGSVRYNPVGIVKDYEIYW